MAIKRQEPICSVAGCENKSLARSLCRRHYQQARTAGTLPEIRKATIRERLLHGAVVSAETGCWNWIMAKDSRGYGLVSVATGRSRGAHRESFKEFVGEIPPGLEVCHACDNRACIRPDHLFLGTHKDNMVDMSVKGRVSSALSLKQAREVRQSKESVSSLAKRFGVGTHVIYKCRRGDTYPANELLGEHE